METKIERIIPNCRILGIFDGKLLASNGYSILQSDNFGESWELIGQMPLNGFKKQFYQFRSLSRLFRRGIQQIYNYDKYFLIVCDGKIFITDANFSFFEKCNLPTKAFQILQHNICIIGNRIYYGEYFPNETRRSVNIYSSVNGTDWDVVYTFPSKSIYHIHLLQYDKYLKRIWFSTGDLDNECILGNANLDFNDIEIIGQNSQRYRSIEIVMKKDSIYWGTDNPNGINCLIKFNKFTKQLEKIARFPGPVYCLKAIDNAYLILTSTEGGRGELDKKAHVYISKDINDNNWTELLSFHKDWMPYIFGFGRLFFGGSHINSLYLYAEGLKDYDHKTIILKYH